MPGVNCLRIGLCSPYMPGNIIDIARKRRHLVSRLIVVFGFDRLCASMCSSCEHM